MNTENLWGNLPKIGNLKTPLHILKEQATAITHMTQGLLVGSVGSSSASFRPFTYELEIRAPALNDYTATIVRIGYDIGLYPVLLVGYQGAAGVSLPDEAAFVAKLAATLQDEKVKGLISSLLVQSNALTGGGEAL
jgi:hypothetical protein